MSLTSGEFPLSGGVCVRRGFTEDELLAAAPSAEPSVFNGAHRSYSLPSATLEGREFIPVVYFTGGLVTMLHLFPCDSPITGWDNWSEEGVLADKKRNDDWMRRVTGQTPEYTAQWGTIGSYHDPKGGFSLISARFEG